MVLAGTVCAVTWWRWRERGGRAVTAGYAVSVAMLPLCHALTLTLVPAQALASLLGMAPAGSAQPGVRSRRVTTATSTAVVALLGAAPLLPYLWLVHRQAMGVAYPLPLTWSNAWTTFAASLAGPPRAA